MRKSASEKLVTEKPPIRLLKLRNPYGILSEWSGKWCHKSEKWKILSANILQNINPYTEKDLEEGYFIICFEDFCEIFNTVDFLHVNLNAFFSSDHLMDDECKWFHQEFHGRWMPGINSGGSGIGNYYDQEAYWLNPQYMLNLSLKNKNYNRVSMIVSLMQIEQVRKRSETDGTYENSNEGISFSIFSITDKNVNVKLINNQKFTDFELKKVGTSGPYLNQREITKRFDYPPGTYVIIPSLNKKNKRMKFLLRVYIEGGLTAEKIKKNDLTKLNTGRNTSRKSSRKSARSQNNTETMGKFIGEESDKEEKSSVCTLI